MVRLAEKANMQTGDFTAALYRRPTNDLTPSAN
jgi:hypothetical protein